MITKIKNLINDKLNTLRLLDIGDSRPYDFYLIFGQKDENKSPWIKSNWENDFEPYFDLLIKQTEVASKTGIKVAKYIKEKRTSKKEKKEFIYHSEIKTGRLNWDLKSHCEWTTRNNDNSYFQNMEIWSPRWTICEKNGSNPDIFITISNERGFENKVSIQFGYFIVVAIAKNLEIDSKPLVKQLSEKINSKTTVLKTRKWGKPEKAGNWTFVNFIQDTFSNGIYKERNLHSFDFKELEFEPIWEIIHKEK